MMKTPRHSRSVARFRAYCVVVAAILMMGCEPDGVEGGPGTFFINLVECPHDWMPHLYQDSLVTPGELALPGALTNVPEFHDCQKLVAANASGLGYLPLAAVFGAWDLVARWDSVRDYLTYLAVRLQVSACTQNQALCACSSSAARCSDSTWTICRLPPEPSGDGVSPRS